MEKIKSDAVIILQSVHAFENDSKGDECIMKYTVLNIEEDVDFGCEECAEDTPIMAVVTMKDEMGAKIKLRQPDQMLYDREIHEGDAVILNEKQELEKLPNEM